MKRMQGSLVGRLVAVALCVVLALPALFVIPTKEAAAWKPEQHSAASTLVLQDILPDGKVTIDGLEYDINPLVNFSITTYPQYYRMGALGIDAYPDFYYSQMFIHPSGDLRDSDSRTYSYHWIDHLLTRAIQEYYSGDYYTSIKAIAFTYGVMAHFAGDMFGHTYINEMAGGPWDLMNDGGRYALRHLIVENYIHKEKSGPNYFDNMDDPFGYPYAPLNDYNPTGNDFGAYLDDKLFHDWLFDAFYRDGYPNSVIDSVWMDFWGTVLKLERAVDRWLAEFDQDLEDRAWWAWPPFDLVTKPYLEEWKQDIQEGIDTFMQTCTVIVAKLFIIQDPDGILDFLTNWARLVPGMLTGPITDAMMKANQWLSDFIHDLMVGVTFGGYALFEELMKWAKKEVAKWLLEQGTGVSWDDIKAIFKNPKEWFTKDSPLDVWRGAPMTGPETQLRVDTDLAPAMQSGVFNPDKFAPMYNTIVMTKLTLLDGRGLNNVLREYGVPAKYPDIAAVTIGDLGIPKTNIMFGQMKSLDADHQWMFEAPPSSSPSALPSYGTGMPIWTDSKAREMMFKKVFHMGTEVAFDKIKIATQWGVPTPLKLNITNTGNRQETYTVQVVRIEGFDGFTNEPSGTRVIGPGETIPFTVNFELDEIPGRDYGGGRLTIRATPQSAGADPYKIFGNEASCTVVAFPYANPTFWLDIDEPVEYTFNEEEEDPATQPYLVHPYLLPRTRFDFGNMTGDQPPLVLCKLSLDLYSPYAYISSKTKMRLYGFSEEGGSFAEMNIRYESAPHVVFDGGLHIVPCPDYKETYPWIDLNVTEVNFVDVGWEHKMDRRLVHAIYTQLVKYVSGVQFVPNPNIYYFNFDQVMAASNVSRPVEWTDDVYILRYWGKTNLAYEYSDSYRVYLDNTPPQTTIRLSEVDNLSARPITVSPRCEVSFSAYDRGAGVEATNYRIVRNMTVADQDSGGSGARRMVNDSTIVVPWTTYNESFNLTKLMRSGHSGDVYCITWYSYDKVSNFEKHGTLKFTLVYDDTPPTTVLSIGSPSVPGALQRAKAFVNHETPINLTATDPTEPLDPDLTGVLETRYRITGSGYEGQWQVYSEPFVLAHDLQDGLYHVEYRSTDKCLNTELTQRVGVVIDTTAPRTEVVLGQPFKAAPEGFYVGADTQISLVANETGSGLNRTLYSLTGPGVSTGTQEYVSPLNLSGMAVGEYVLDYCSTDNMSNAEQDRSVKLSLVSSVYYAGAHNVSGTVYDSLSGDPLAGASISLSPGDYAVTTGVSGEYSVLVPDGSYTVTASRTGYEPLSGTVSLSDQDVDHDIELEPSRYVMSGMVYDQSSGAPIAGAAIGLSPGGLSAVTDGSGSYQIAGVLSGTYAVTVTSAGYRTAIGTVTVVYEDLKGNFGLAKMTYSLGGHVNAPKDGAGIAGASVSLSFGNRFDETDESGSYLIDGIPDGSYTVTVAAHGYKTVSTSVTISGEDLVRDFVLEPLAPCTFCLSGHVYDQSTGEPIEGAALKSGLYSCETNQFGQYSLTVPNGTYTVRVTAPGYTECNVTAVVSGDNVTVDVELTSEDEEKAKTSGISVPALGVVVAIVAAAAVVLSLLLSSRRGKRVPPQEELPPPPPDSNGPEGGA